MRYGKTRYAIRLLPALIAMAILMMRSIPIKASADAKSQFYIPDTAVPAGQQFTVSVEFTADQNIGTVQAQITYDDSAIEFVSSDFGVGAGGLVNITAFPDSASSTLMVSMTFRAIAPGSTQIDLIGGSVMSPDGLMLTSNMTAYAAVTIGDAVSSLPDSSASENSGEIVQTPSRPDRDTSQAQLKSLTVSEGHLVPAFSPDIYEYTVTLPHNVDYLAIDAETAVEGAGIWFEGSEYLADGIVPRTVTVTAPDGITINVYSISVIRLAEGETEFSSGDEDEYVIPGNEAFTDSDMTQSTAETVPTTKRSLSDDSRSGVDELRDKLMPVLIIAMVAIVLVIVILVVWVRNKSKNKLI